MGRSIRVSLKGELAELGRVPAADVGRLLVGVERAAARAAMSVLRLQRSPSGRRGRVIEDAVHLRLVSVERGSVAAVLEVPAADLDPDALDIEVDDLGDQAIIKTIEVADTDGEDDVGVAQALARLSNDLAIGERYEAIEFDDTAAGGRRVLIDGDRRAELTELVQRLSDPDQRSDRVIGTLVEADFEKLTARLRLPTNQAVTVEFPEELADDIKSALRERTAVQGVVTFDSRTNIAVSVDVQEVIRANQLELGIDDSMYWETKPVLELATEQGVSPVTDAERLWDRDATEEEVEAFLAALEK